MFLFIDATKLTKSISINRVEIIRINTRQFFLIYIVLMTTRN